MPAAQPFDEEAEQVAPSVQSNPFARDRRRRSRSTNGQRIVNAWVDRMNCGSPSISMDSGAKKRTDQHERRSVRGICGSPRIAVCLWSRDCGERGRVRITSVTAWPLLRRPHGFMCVCICGASAAFVDGTSPERAPRPKKETRKRKQKR